MSMNPAAASPTLLVTTLAIYQTEFWIEVAAALKAENITCVFLSFDDRSTELIRSRGFEAFSASEAPPQAPLTDDAFTATLKEFGIDDGPLWLGHEKLTFGIHDVQRLKGRFAAYLTFADRVCRQLRERGEVVLVQEVGGFLCVSASYFAARRNGIDNYFIEPSFYRGRLFFTRNTFAAPQPRVSSGAVTDEVRTYLQKTLAGRQIVVPLKDSHHYSKVTRKIFNMRNGLRLVQKFVDKHLLGKHQEFGHIGHHVRTHLRMLVSSMKLRSHYATLKSLGRFVYFPFHVPADMALTIRAPQYLDQLALVRDLALALPPGVTLAVKEHPAMIGAINATPLIELLRNHSNLVLLDPSCNNYDVLALAELVVSVNSKSGAESALTGTPVIALGDSFYRSSGIVHSVENIADVRAKFASLLSAPKQPPDPALVMAFFQSVWESSYPGELFVASADNARVFARTMQAALGTTQFATLSPR